MFPLCLSPDPTDGGASSGTPTDTTDHAPESGGTPESTGETHDAAPQPEPADKQAAEGDQGASDIGPTIEALKRQLRAVTQERSAERQRANDLEQQLEAARPQEPDGAPAIPGIPTHTEPPEAGIQRRPLWRASHGPCKGADPVTGSPAREAPAWSAAIRTGGQSTRTT